MCIMCLTIEHKGLNAVRKVMQGQMKEALNEIQSAEDEGTTLDVDNLAFLKRDTLLAVVNTVEIRISEVEKRIQELTQ